MSNDKNKNKTQIEKIGKWIKHRQEKVSQQELEDIPISTLKISLIVHMVFIALFFLQALVSPYSNGLQVFACFYLTFSLSWLAYHYRNKIKIPIQRSIKFILFSTVAGFLMGSLAYYSPIGDKLEKKEFDSFFEREKLLIGDEYYNTYLKNKDNINELKILRERIYKDLNI